MNQRFFKPLFMLGLSCSAFVAGGAWAYGSGTYGVAPPAVYPSKTWQGRSEAVVRVLNRLDAHVSELSIPVGQEASYQSLTFRVMSCVQRPSTLPSDAAVHVHIEETKAQNVPVFDGWMFANSPSLGVYGNPLYDVQIVRCQGQDVAPQVPPLPKMKAPTLGIVAAPHVDADNLGSSSNASAAHGQGGGGGGPMSLLPPEAPTTDGSAQPLPAPSDQGYPPKGP